MTAVGAAGPRPSRDERRAQLLDAAGRLLVERGLAGFTMEGLAAQAGVSKALPYRHFSGADDAVVALYRREIGDLSDRLLTAARGARAGDPMVAAGVRAYFAAVAERGRLLAVLAGPGSAIPALAEGRRPAPHAGVLIVEEAYGVTGPVAAVLGAMVDGLATAGAESIGRRLVTAGEAERLTTAAVLATVHAVLGAGEPG